MTGYYMQFGWEDDAGVGEMLIAQTLAGVKTATCTFRRACTEAEATEIFAATGHTVPVLDAGGTVRGHVEILDVFETTFGDPDLRLVRGEGDGEDVARFQSDHRRAWQATMGDLPLTDDEVLIVELFRLAHDE